MTDKLQARKLAQRLRPDIRLPDIVWEGESAENFPFDSIELPVVVKVNNGSGWNFFLRDRSPKERGKLNRFFHTMRRHKRYGRTIGEWSYLSLERRYYAERELVDSSGLPPDDYKLYFSNGRLTQMHVAHDRWGDKALVNFGPDLQVMPVDEAGWRRDYVPRTGILLTRSSVRVARWRGIWTLFALMSTSWTALSTSANSLSTPGRE